MTLDQTTPNQPRLRLSIDPAWLHDPRRLFPMQRRLFPIHLDLPILTAFSAMDSGQFGTLKQLCA